MNMCMYVIRVCVCVDMNIDMFFERERKQGVTRAI